MGTLSRRTAGFCALLLAGLAGCPDEATDPAEEPPGPERASREDEAPPDEAPEEDAAGPEVDFPAAAEAAAAEEADPIAEAVVGLPPSGGMSLP